MSLLDTVLDLTAEPLTLCKPGQRVTQVLLRGDYVELRVEGPRKAVHKRLGLTPERARELAAWLVAAANEVDSPSPMPWAL